MDFNSLITREDVSRFFGIDDKQLRYLLYVTKPDNCYSSFRLQKKNGTIREISIPNSKLKHLQEKVLRELEKQYEPKKCSYGFIKGKDFIQNAKCHLNKRIILNIDLKVFFNQIHFGRVRGILISQPYGLGQEAASVIAHICCYNQHLPQGAPTSPIVANMVANCLDTQLIRLAKKYRLTYTRYADDITFSTNKIVFPKEIVQTNKGIVCLGDELSSVLSNASFVVNNEKIHVQTKMQRQEVTGIIVNEKINVKRSYIDEIRILFHKIKKEGIYDTAKKYVLKNQYKYKKLLPYTKVDSDVNREKLETIFSQILKGKILFLGNVRGKYDSYYLKYAKYYNSVFDTYKFNIEEEDIFTEQCHRNIFVIEELDGEGDQGSGVYIDGYGILTNFHVVEKDLAYKMYNKYTSTVLEKEKCYQKNKEIDFACYKYKKENGFKISNNPSYERGKNIIIAGYPSYAPGDSCNIQQCQITGTKIFFGQKIISVSASIIHGASGGAVLDEKHEIIGIIRSGNLPSYDDNDNKFHFVSGFIPITDIISI